MVKGHIKLNDFFDVVQKGSISSRWTLGLFRTLSTYKCMAVENGSSVVIESGPSTYH